MALLVPYFVVRYCWRLDGLDRWMFRLIPVRSI